MLSFLLAAIAGYLLAHLAPPVLRDLDSGLDAARSGGRSLVSTLASHWLRLVAVAVVVGLVAGFLVRWDLLDSSTNLRVALGLAFGAVLRNFTRRRDEPGDTASDLPWWCRPQALRPLALLLIALLALLAPHGEFDFGGLRSIKTPLVEAQFARADVDLRFQLETEPTGFFGIAPDGLGMAGELLQAENEWRQLTGGPPATLPIEFAKHAVRPVTVCAEFVERLFGTRQLIAPMLSRYGSALTAVVIDLSSRPPDAAVLAGIPGRIDKAAHAAMADLNALLPGIVAASPNDPCSPLRIATLQTFLTGLDWPVLAADPLLVLTVAMLHLWSGSPDAAIKVLILAPDRGADGAAVGLDYLEGFARRWAAQPVTAYVPLWNREIARIESRLARLKKQHGGEIDACTDDGAVPLEVRLLPDPPEPPSAARLYGWYFVFLQDLRNHAAYQTAGAIMRHPGSRGLDGLASAALEHADSLTAVADDRALEQGSCLRQRIPFQRPVLRGGAVSLVDDTYNSTPADPKNKYAVYLDAAGALRLALAASTEPPDEAQLERARTLLDRSLQYAVQVEGFDSITTTIREHRDHARRLLGLTVDR